MGVYFGVNFLMLIVVVTVEAKVTEVKLIKPCSHQHLKWDAFNKLTSQPLLA